MLQSVQIARNAWNARKSFSQVDWTWNDGTHFSRLHGVWLYNVIPTTPLVYGSDETRYEVSHRMRQMMHSVAADTLATRISKIARLREFHILSVHHEQPEDLSQDPPELARYLLEHIYNVPQSKKTVFIGFKLQPRPFKVTGSRPPSEEGLTSDLRERLRKAGERVTLDSPAALEPFEKDKEFIEGIFANQKCRRPTTQEMSVLQFWDEPPEAEYNGMARYYEYPQYVEIDNSKGDNYFWEMRGVAQITQELPEEPWLALANAEGDGCWVISARGKLEPGATTRRRVRRQIRKQEEKLEALDSVGEHKIEHVATLDEMEDLEAHLALTEEPTITDFSIVTAKRLFPDEDAPREWAKIEGTSDTQILKERYGVITVPANVTQMQIMGSMIPCGDLKAVSIKPFAHHVTLDLLTDSGITACSQLGDGVGAHLGYSVPDGGPVRLDYKAASGLDKTPMMAVCGEPGSGKTVLCQFLLTQAALAGQSAVYVNPKGQDTLSYMLDTVSGKHIVIGEDSSEGMLDPYKYATGTKATNIALGFLDIIAPDIEPGDRAKIEAVLRRNKGHARCFMDALEGLDNKELLERIVDTRENPIAALCISDSSTYDPTDDLDITSQGAGIILIEFSSDVELPQGPTDDITKITPSQRYGLAAVGLLMQSIMQIVGSARRGQAGGGLGSFLVMDEAWILLASKTLAKTYVESLGRLGRSLDVNVVLATQRATDIIRAELESYVSRSVMMKLTDSKEQTAAMTMLGLDPANQRFRDVLGTSGSERREDPDTGEIIRLAPQVWHKDLHDNVGVMQTSLPASVLDRFSTNPDDRRKFIEELAEETA